MISLLPATETLLDEVERFAHRRFLFRTEIGMLIEALDDRSQAGNFERLIFLAKFLTNAAGILSRSGLGTDETRQLEHEYRESVGRAHALLQDLQTTIRETDRAAFVQFSGLTHGHVKNFMALMNELSWIKNYLLDTRTSLGPS